MLQYNGACMTSHALVYRSVSHVFSPPTYSPPPSVLSPSHLPSLLMTPAADLSSLPPRQVAELLAAVVRLGHDPGGPWVAGMLAQLEARSALFDRMDHAMLRSAWAELSSARARHKAMQGRSKVGGATGKRKAAQTVEEDTMTQDASGLSAQ